MILHHLSDLEEVKIISRPSKICKTPYVADIELKNGLIVQAHSASLGCCGLCEKNCIVLASPINSNNENSKSKVCSYKIYLVNIYEEKIINENKFINKQIVGIDPKLAEILPSVSLPFSSISFSACCSLAILAWFFSNVNNDVKTPTAFLRASTLFLPKSLICVNKSVSLSDCTGPKVATPAPTTPAPTNRTIMYVIIAIVVLLILGGVGAVLMSGNDDDDYDE